MENIHKLYLSIIGKQYFTKRIEIFEKFKYVLNFNSVNKFTVSERKCWLNKVNLFAQVVVPYSFPANNQTQSKWCTF